VVKIVNLDLVDLVQNTLICVFESLLQLSEGLCEQ